VFAVFDKQHAVVGVFVVLLLFELCYSLCDCGCDVFPVFCLDHQVVDAVDVSDVVLSSCAEHASHRFTEQLCEQYGQFTFCSVSFAFIRVCHLLSLPRGSALG